MIINWRKRRRKADLDDGHLGAVNESNGHLQEDPEAVSDVIGIELLEALGAVSALQQKRLSHCGLSQPRLQPPRLSGEHDWRERLQSRQNIPELVWVPVNGQLMGLLGFPRVQGPC